MDEQSFYVLQTMVYIHSGIGNNKLYINGGILLLVYTVVVYLVTIVTPTVFSPWRCGHMTHFRYVIDSPFFKVIDGGIHLLYVISLLWSHWSNMTYISHTVAVLHGKQC